MSTSFLRQYAQTQHFSLGQPRSFAIAGSRIFFVRSRHGTDPQNCLWMIDTAVEFQETLLVDPAKLNQHDEALPEAERKRRERAREIAGGIVNYSVNKAGTIVAFVLSGDMYVLHVGNEPLCLLSGVGAFDPRLSPDGAWLAYVQDGALKVVNTGQNAVPRMLAEDADPDVTWGQADFIAAEEMDRLRGYWWSPDSRHVLASKVDNRPVAQWHIADPGNPAAEPQTVRYPAAGTANAQISLAIIAVETSQQTPVGWDNDLYPYLVDVDWSRDEPLITVQSRDQKAVMVYRGDLAGTLRAQHEITDERWVELAPGFPAQLPDGRLLTLTDEPRSRRLRLDDAVVTPPHLQVRSLGGVLADNSIILTAWDADPKGWHVWQLTTTELLRLNEQPSVCSVLADGYLVVVVERDPASVAVKATVYRTTNNDWKRIGVIDTKPEKSLITAQPQFLRCGERQLETALLLPTNYDGHSKLPVLMDPYGGPHAQRVLLAQGMYLESQWFADQGFAVVIVDGRGTPGRSPEWEKAIAGNLLDPVLDDQVAALQALAVQDSRLDMNRVAVRGWSFGGYLAAAAVLHRPEVFHAAIAGAPVTDWTLYDTHYTERYLGDPNHSSDAYQHTSLIEAATKLARPLLLIHGLADDNVVFANTLRLSNALLAVGKPHQVLPLANMTHMANDPVVGENLAKLELEFLRAAL